MIMTAAALDEEQRADLPHALKGNLCRCTGYRSIDDALHGVGERRGRRRRQGAAAPACPTRSPTASSPARRATRWTSPIEGMLHLKVLRSPHAHARIMRIDREQGARRARRRRRLHLGGRAAPALQHGDCTRTISSIPTTPTCSTTSSASSASASPRWSPRREAAAEAGCRALEVDYEILPAVFDPGRRHGARRADPARQGRGRHRQRQHLRRHPTARSAAWPRASRRPTSSTRMTYSTSRVQHVHLETHGSIAWRGEDGRWHVRTSSQAPVHRARRSSAYLFGLPAAQRPRLHRARRRRLRRQAGDALGRPLRARRR